MATTGKSGKSGRDRQGRWRAGFMTHAELVGELETATGPRRDELAGEARERMASKTYPRFPARLGLAMPDDQQEAVSEQQGHAECADAGAARQPGDAGDRGVPVDSHG